MRFDGGGNDGIEIQASRDDGKTWKKIIRYDARYYAKMLKNWRKMSVTIDELNGADVLSDSTMVRFIQPQNNKFHDFDAFQWIFNGISAQLNGIFTLYLGFQFPMTEFLLSLMIFQLFSTNLLNHGEFDDF